MKFRNILLVTSILAGLLFAGCLSGQTNKDLSETQRGLGMPSIRLLSPVGGETLSGVVEIRWQVNDPSKGDSKVNIYYTTDPKPFCPTCPPQEWHEIASGIENIGVYEWDTTKVEDNMLYSIKVTVDDGIYVVSDKSEGFITIKNGEKEEEQM